LAAYKTLLYRHVGQDDIVVGTDLAGRSQTELEGLVGFFVNLLVLRTDLSGNPTFRGLLARVRETAIGAFAHQDVPFDRLVEELQPKRHRSRTPLFQMLFVMENVPLETLHLPGLTMTPMPSQADTARFDLALFVREQDGGIVTKWTYKTDLFDRSTIQRLARQYLVLLENIVAAPDTRLNELALQTEAEIRHQALEENRHREARMSSLVPGRRRARKLPEKPGEAEVNRPATEDDAATDEANDR
jgi:non-ribosomal peptide synthetase component F